MGSRYQFDRLTSLLLATFAMQASFAEEAEQLGGEITSNVGTAWVQATGNDTISQVRYTEIDDLAVIEGDIVIGKTADFSLQNSLPDSDEYALAISVTSIGSLWEDGVLPYQIDSDLLGTGTEQKIEAAIAHVAEHSAIQFVPRNTENAALYPDYVEFVNSTGCASYIGRRGGRQSIWLASSCSTGNAIHELGHALGLYHEQARDDRDQYVTINWGNITSGKSHNFEQQLSNATDSGAYDYGSVMHYGSYFFSSNGSPTIVTINPVGAPIGQRIGLSEGDILALGQLYSSDLSLLLQAYPDLVEPGAMITLDAHVTNLQGNSARGLALTVPLPVGSEFVGADGALWDCQLGSAEVTCRRDTLAGSEASTLSLFLTAPDYGFPLTLSAELDSTGVDSDTSNNTDSIDLIIDSQNFAPVIESGQSFSVYHLSESGVSFGRIAGFDYNGDRLHDFEIATGALKQSVSINPLSGELFVNDNQLWDIEQTPNFTLGVTVSDGQVTSSITTITIALTHNDTFSGNNSSGGSAALTVLWLYSLILLWAIQLLCARDIRCLCARLRLYLFAVLTAHENHDNSQCQRITRTVSEALPARIPHKVQL